jgi:hypothetical protein
VHSTRVQSKILELIEEWRQTICQTSQFKDDLGFIRDMHRLLSYKGYVFPEVRKEDAAVLNPSDVRSLKPEDGVVLLTLPRISDPQRKWLQKNEKPNPQNYRSSSAVVDRRTYRKRTNS